MDRAASGIDRRPGHSAAHLHYIEEHPTYLAGIKPFFEAAERGDFRVVTSFVTLIEAWSTPFAKAGPS
jgi:hypothetical protein